MDQLIHPHRPRKLSRSIDPFTQPDVAALLTVSKLGDNQFTEVTSFDVTLSAILSHS